jgi:hypothetical protein
LNKRVRLLGTNTTQIIQLPALSSFAANNGFYFDNSVGGQAQQAKLLTNGIDKVRYNGFINSNLSLLNEFWVSKSEHLLLRKFDDTCWEVINDYKGSNVGEKITVGFHNYPGIILENGQLVNGEEYPRLYWWIKNVLPITHVYFSNNVSGQFTPDADKIGQFALHPTLPIFRMPNTQGLMEKGLANFINYGNDNQRAYDYPGGFQNDLIKSHSHLTTLFSNGIGNSPDPIFSKPAITGNRNASTGTMITNAGVCDINGNSIGGSEQRVKNIGVLFGRRI